MDAAMQLSAGKWQGQKDQRIPRSILSLPVQPRSLMAQRLTRSKQLVNITPNDLISIYSDTGLDHHQIIASSYKCLLPVRNKSWPKPTSIGEFWRYSTLHTVQFQQIYWLSRWLSEYMTIQFLFFLIKYPSWPLIIWAVLSNKVTYDNLCSMSEWNCSTPNYAYILLGYFHWSNWYQIIINSIELLSWCVVCMEINCDL